MRFFPSVALLAGSLAAVYAADPIFSLACSSEFLCRGLAADGQGRVFVAGTNWDGASGGPRKVYVGRLDGGALAFFKEIGGSPFDRTGDMAVDVHGNVYLTGTIGSEVRPGAFRTEVFVLKLDASGAVLYSIRFGAEGGYGFAVAADGEGSAYASGGEGGRPFIAKVQPDGSLAYMTHPEIAGTPILIALETDGAVAALVRSQSGSALVRLDSAGAVREVRDLGAWFDARRVARAGDGSLWVAGMTSAFGAPVTPDAVLRDPVGCAYYRQGERGTLLVSQVHALVAGPDGVLYAGADEGAFRSRDQGRTWEGIQNGLPTAAVRALAVDPGNPQRLYAGVDSSPALFATSDGGESWEALGEGPRAPIQAIAVDPNTSSVLFAGGGPGPVLWKSTDGGRSWNHDPAWPAGVNGIAVAPDSTIYVSAYFPIGGLFFTFPGGGVFRSRDGETFTRLRSTDPIPTGVFVDPQVKDRVYVVHGGGLLRSDDAGDNWERRDLAGVRSLAFDAGMLFALLTDGRVLGSQNAGDRFDPVMGGGAFDAQVLAVSSGTTHVGASVGQDLFLERWDEGRLAFATLFGDPAAGERPRPCGHRERACVGRG